MKICLLHIDDDESDLETIARGLKVYAGQNGVDIELEQCADLETALKMIDRKHFDCIVTDLKLVAYKGKEVVESLRAKTNCPIIAFSGIFESKYTREIMSAGADDFLIKGENEFDRVLRACVTAIGRRERLDTLDRLAGE